MRSIPTSADSPVNASEVDLGVWPRVADAEVVEATLDAGDVLLIPSWWTHYVLHHPLGGGGSCVAITFTRQAAGEDERTARPFAADIAGRWRERVRARDDDPAWRAWRRRRGSGGADGVGGETCT